MHFHQPVHLCGAESSCRLKTFAHIRACLHARAHTHTPLAQTPFLYVFSYNQRSSHYWACIRWEAKVLVYHRGCQSWSSSLLLLHALLWSLYFNSLIIYLFGKALFQGFSKFDKPLNFLEGLIKHRSLGPIPGFLFRRSEVDLRICSSDKLLLEAVTPSVFVTIGRPNPCHQHGVSKQREEIRQDAPLVRQSRVECMCQNFCECSGGQFALARLDSGRLHGRGGI